MSKNKKNGFRVFGDELGRNEAWVDVNVSGTDREGNIYIEEVSSKDTPEEWSMGADRLGELYEDDLIVASDEIPVENHKMWKTLEEIGTTRAEVDINNFVDEKLRDSARALFRALIEAGK